MRGNQNYLMVAALTSMLFLAGCGKQAATQASTEKARAIPVRTAAIEQRDIRETVSVTGTLKALSQVQVVSELNARLVRVLKDEGDRVSKGETLAVLDATDFSLAYQRAKAAVQAAEASRSHAMAEKERAEVLLNSGGITDKDHLAAQVNLQVAEARLAQAKAESAIAAQQVSRGRIVAPFSGKVGKRHVDAGTMLAVGTPVFTVVDNAEYEFRGSVPSTEFAKIKLGAPVEITVDTMPGYSAEGKVVRVSPMVEERSRTFEVVARVADKPGLVGGLFARANIDVGEVKGALMVPPAALIRNGGGGDVAKLFVVENGTASEHEVKLGIETVNGVQVMNDLKPGAAVVVDPPTTLTSGSAVETQGAQARQMGEGDVSK